MQDVLRIVDVLDDKFDEVLSVGKLSQMVERSKELEAFQQSASTMSNHRL